MEISNALSAGKLADEMLAYSSDGAGADVPMGKIFGLFTRIKLLVCAEAVRCMDATRQHYDKGTESWETEIDYRVRMQACEFIRDTMEGKPAQSTYNFNVDAGGGKLNAMEIMAGDPKAVAMLRELADKAEAAQKRGAKGGRPQKVVVEAVADTKPAAAPVPPA